MSVNGDLAAQLGSHPYKGSQLTRPDWPTKHDFESKSRNLLQYILKPAKYKDKVVRDTLDVVTIKDMYPKGQVHLLVLPKWQPHRDLHPHDAFEDPDFLAIMRKEAGEALKIAMPMLRAQMHSALLEDGMKQKEVESLLDKRDFAKDFQIGIHAHPSQHELHVHIISRDMVSSHPYGSRHYQAFNTPFLVPLKLYPLPPDAQRREVNYQNTNLMQDDFICWRCGQNMGSDWPGMKEHLRGEYKSWIRESSDGQRLRNNSS